MMLRTDKRYAPRRRRARLLPEPAWSDLDAGEQLVWASDLPHPRYAAGLAAGHKATDGTTADNALLK